MKTKVSPPVVGLFVLGALALGIVALLSFGGISFFSKPQRFVVYFAESIHGLDLGSPVKLRGVRIGRVVALNVRYSATTPHDSTVAVICELSKNVITDEKGAQIDSADRGRLQAMIDRGLRAQLGVLGLATGLLFVELDFFDPEMYPAKSDTTDIRYAVIPAVPSTISEFQASFSEILADLKKVDFSGLSREVHGLLVDTRRQVAAMNLAELSTQWARAGQSVTTLTTSPEIKQTFTNLNVAIAQLTATLAKIDGQVEPAGTKLGETLVQAKETLKNFNAAAVAARNFISSQSGLGDEATRSLEQLSEAAAAVQRLADFLERNPNALLSGKKSPR